jgi:Pentapeptide repeats (8 copies)
LAHRLRSVVLLIIGLAFLLCLVLLAPKLLVPARPDASLHDVADPAKRHELEDARLKLQNDVRTTLLQALGGAVIALGAVFTYRQLQVNREGQITERFTRAIDQLGNDKGQLDVTLGGIYALERIAKDSPADRATIVEILTAYVRREAAWPPRAADPVAEAAPLDELASLQERCPGVQAAMTVLCRMPSDKRDRLDLQRTDLRKADLHGAHLEWANLDGAHLEGANLSLAHLEWANLHGAHLEKANLTMAYLKSVYLGYAHLKETDIAGAHLEEAYLEGTDLTRAKNIADVRPEGVYPRGARLKGAWADERTRWPDGFDWRAAGVQEYPALPHFE